MKKVAIIQSSYIPWKGYFDIIHDVDCFIFLDDVQYTSRDWRNRNRIKTNAGLKWLTIPLGSHRDRQIRDIRLPDLRWRDTHLQTMERFYRKARHFGAFYDRIRDFYHEQEWTHLSAFNQNFITRFSREILGLRTEFLDSAAIAVPEKKHGKIVGLLEAVGGDFYVSGPLARNYLDEGEFRRRNITLSYKDYSAYPEYEQSYPPFSHQVSIVDLLFHAGENIAHYIWGWRASADHDPIQ
jgi:hypothetical protein